MPLLPEPLLASARSARAEAREHSGPGTAVVLEGEASPDPAPELADAGYRVAGHLVLDALGADPAAAYADPVQVLLDPALGLVSLAGPAGGLLPACLAAGLDVLLPEPVALPADVLHEAGSAAQTTGAVCAAALPARWREASARLAALPPAPLLTVRGWGRGEASLVDLVDLLRLRLGDVVAAAAAPADLPARELPGGAPVRVALLTAGGTTVLVAEAAGPPLLRLSGAGDPLDVPVADGDITHRAVLASAMAVRAAADERLRPGGTAGVARLPAGLQDLRAADAVLTAWRRSAAERRWVELA